MAHNKSEQKGGAANGPGRSNKGQPLVTTEVHLPLDLVELLRDVAFARFVRHDLGEHSVSRIIADVLELHRVRLEAEAKMTLPSTALPRRAISRSAKHRAGGRQKIKGPRDYVRGPDRSALGAASCCDRPSLHAN